ncbi:unnamed protein product [marine sediment metagenome]|uniref:Uncharacterized protein n=1 Tax=marine sediment metagenome TaxID=412755 RepID=X1I5Y2_9ZZZZ
MIGEQINRADATHPAPAFYYGTGSPRVFQKLSALRKAKGNFDGRIAQTIDKVAEGWEALAPDLGTLPAERALAASRKVVALAARGESHSGCERVFCPGLIVANTRQIY